MNEPSYLWSGERRQPEDGELVGSGDGVFRHRGKGEVAYPIYKKVMFDCAAQSNVVFSVYASHIEQTANLNHSPLIVTWWAGAAYRSFADALICSVDTSVCDYLALTSDRDTRGWEQTCSRKPLAILFAMSLAPSRPVLWVDADAVIERPICWDRIFPLGKEAAALVSCLRPRGRWPNRVNSTLLSGTLGFTPRAKPVVERWAQACAESPHHLDQDTLERVLSNDVEVSDLPPEYCCIPDLMNDVQNPVIVHRQASRLTECRFGSPLSPEK